MIKKIICAIWGHDTKNITIDDISRISMSQDGRVFAEYRVCKCARCGELAFLGRGVLQIELIDLIQCTLKDLPSNWLEQAFSFRGLHVSISDLYDLKPSNDDKSSDSS